MELFKRMRKRGGGSSPASSSAVPAAADSGRLGGEVIALRLESGAAVPAECTAVLISQPSGQTRRIGAFGTPRLSLGEGEVAWCFHPGPYVFAVAPFPAASEAGLRVEFLIDAGDPRVQQQRFDLFLASEWCGAAGPLTVAGFGAGVQLAVQNALAEGLLDLPPCTSVEEWHAFRGGLNELLYTRFGVTVQDCYPIDLHPATDLAATLAATLATYRARPDAPSDAAPPTVTRRNAAPTAAAQPAAAPSAAAGIVPSAVAPAGASTPTAATATGAAAIVPVEGGDGEAAAGSASRSAPAAGSARGHAPFAGHPAAQPAPQFAPVSESAPAPQSSPAKAATSAAADAFALRRLFLELPPATTALRMITPPASAFATQQELLQRLSLAALDVNTMPSLAWKTPGQPLPEAAQGARAAAAEQATTALNTIWSLLAKLKQAPEADIGQLFDEADRLIANLEFALFARRSTGADNETMPAELQGGAISRERREPTLGNQ